MVPFYLTICAVICAIASFIHGQGFDGLAWFAVLFVILAAVTKYVGQQLTNGTRK